MCVWFLCCALYRFDVRASSLKVLLISAPQGFYNHACYISSVCIFIQAERFFAKIRVLICTRVLECSCFNKEYC